VLSPPRSKAGTAPNFGEVPTILVILEDRLTTVAPGMLDSQLAGRTREHDRQRLLVNSEN